MLNATQPLQDIQRFVSMLCTSVFGDSFGPQLSNEAQQRQNESHILDVVTRLLVEVPDVSAEEPGSRRSKIVQLRKEVVHFLGCLVGTERGSKLIIGHNSALSRLVRRISDELDDVYDFKGDVRSRYLLFPPPLMFVCCDNDPESLSPISIYLIIRCINESVFIVSNWSISRFDCSMES